MEKKISINYENDEVVSIEVDGVQYARPEDIPDADDREKVEMLISKSDDADFDEPFDSAAFEKEFKEIRRETARFPIVLFTVFLSVAVIMLGIAAFSGLQAYRTMSQEQSTPGRVVDMVERQSYDNDTRQYTVYSYPVVEFDLPDGPTQHIQLNEGSNPPGYKTGDAVTILYIPGQPQNARIKSFSSALLMWLLPALTGILGTVFLVVTLIVLRVHRAQQAELEAEGILS